MNYEQITIVVNEFGWLRVEFGKGKKARLEWRAAGLEIYLRGAFPVKLYASAANMAINECQARNIPTSSLRRAQHGD